MIQTLTTYESSTTDPYTNLAVEEYLTFHAEPGECILYLWQNAHTVVIGRNQNCWKECRVSELEADGGHLVRRLSGGGAVYHDLGNLNFTFCMRKEDADVDRQLQVIIEAVASFGLTAEKTGRNDVAINGQKFSGNAFYEQEQHCYHHGTLMMNVNKEMLSKYLTVSKEKLQSKGVDSVKSRVTNLVDYIPDLTLEALKKALREAFEEVYGLTSNECKMEDLDQKEIEMRTKHFSSWDWRFGRKIDFQYEISKRFSWGQMNIQFQVDKGKISDVNVYSDSLKPMTIEKLPKYLKGIRYHKKNICSELRLYWAEDKQEEEMIADIIEWIKEEEL